MRAKSAHRLIEASALLLFVLQALRALLAPLFGLIYDAVFDQEGFALLGIVSVLLLAMLALPLFVPQRSRPLQLSMAVTACVCACARIPISLDVPVLRLVCALLVFGFAGVYLAGLLRVQGAVLVPALAVAASVDQVLRALGQTLDPGLQSGWLWVQIPLSAGVVWLALRLARGRAPDLPVSGDAYSGLRLGMVYGAGLFLLSSLLALPNAAARWTSGSYVLMVAGLLALPLLLLAFGLAGWYERHLLARRPWLRWVLYGVLMGGLAGAYLGQGVLAMGAVLLAGAAFWLLLPASLRPNVADARIGLAIGGLLFVLLATAHAFAFTYAYTLPQFRGAGLPIFLLGATLVAAPAWRWRALAGQPTPVHKSRPLLWSLGIAVWLLAVFVAYPWSPTLSADVPSVRLGTYNIHYGFDTHWHLSLEAQARTIEESGADVVALQEVDTGRLTSYGVDDALWLAHRLGMQVVYLPTVEHTTGIAILSRLAIAETAATLLPSLEEPTGVIRVWVSIGGQPVALHGVWLGLSTEERERQLTRALEFIGEGRATLAGDMNASPDSPVYAQMLAAGFRDPFTQPGLVAEPTDPSETPTQRIDYVWLRGLAATAGQVLPSLASDHRMVVVAADVIAE